MKDAKSEENIFLPIRNWTNNTKNQRHHCLVCLIQVKAVTKDTKKVQEDVYSANESKNGSTPSFRKPNLRLG